MCGLDQAGSDIDLAIRINGRDARCNPVRTNSLLRKLGHRNRVSAATSIKLWMLRTWSKVDLQKCMRTISSQSVR